MTLDDKSELAREILRYLAKNPEGMDTLEGIARFWLTSRHVDEIVDSVQSMLATLVHDGYLKEHVVRSAAGSIMHRYYQLNADRKKEILALNDDVDTTS